MLRDARMACVHDGLNGGRPRGWRLARLPDMIHHDHVTVPESQSDPRRGTALVVALGACGASASADLDR